MTKRYQLELTLVEDAHFGAGTGAGDTDALIERDARGLPVIRASHLKGVLRESAELSRDFGLCSQGDIDSLFGKGAGQRGSLTCTSLYQTGEATDCPIWTSTARELHSRAPREDTLRIVEHCAAGTRFTGELQLLDARHAELLHKLITRTDRLGGDRNRGNGLATLKLEASPNSDGRSKGQPQGRQPRLRLIFRNVDPLLLPNSGNPGNLLETEGFIRGQILLGAFVQRLLQDQDNPYADRLLQGEVGFGDALPLPREIQPSENDIAGIYVIPIPLALKTPKPAGQNGEFPWWAKAKGHGAQPLDKDNTSDDLDETSDGPKRKRPGPRQFLYRPNAAAAWQRFEPEINVRMRVNVGMRVTDGKTGLFSHEEIAEGTHFVSDLTFSNTAAAEAFNSLLHRMLSDQTWLRIGREGRPVQLIHAVWLKTATQEEPRSRWRLTLTSDLILRDDSLAFITRPDIYALITAVGKTPADFSDSDTWRIDTRHCESTAVHGFNAVTGLRRAPALALRRGADFMIEGKGSEQLAAELARLPALGERTHEGYGRFVINFTPFGGQTPANVMLPPAIERPDEAILAIAKSLADTLHEKQKPSRSQLGWLRGVAESNEPPAKIIARIRAAEDKQGGKAWKPFRDNLLKEMEQAFGKPPLTNDEDAQRQCLIDLVRWLKPRLSNQAAQSNNEAQENPS